MASIGHEGKTRRVLVVIDGKRHTIRLGEVTRRDAEAVCRHVEALVSSKASGQPIEPATAAWLPTISDKLHKRIAKAGLIAPRERARAVKLGAFMADYISQRADIKGQTSENLRQAERHLLEYFGPDRDMASITPGDADAFYNWMITDAKRQSGHGKNKGRRTGAGLATATARRHAGRGRQFYRAAIRRELVHRNPFDGLSCTVRENRDKARFIDIPTTNRILEVCDEQWKLIVLLCRYAGVRCPSEITPLTWDAIDFEKNIITLISPKTAHIDGMGQRIIPLWPELRGPLLAAFNAAPEGSTHVITLPKATRTNLRTQFMRILRRAGVAPWPRPFHNMRSSRQTELCERFPIHVVCQWMGNSVAVASRHYLQVTDAHLEAAITTATNPAQNPAQSVSISADNDLQAESVSVTATPTEGPENAVFAGDSGEYLLSDKRPREDSNL